MIAGAIVEISYIDAARELLEVCRVPRDMRRLIWVQAFDDARREHPDLPITTQRALAARRIAVGISRWARRNEPRTEQRGFMETAG